MKQIKAKQNAKIHPCLSVQRGNLRISNTVFINALPYVLENGCKRRVLPKWFGNWSAVYAPVWPLVPLRRDRPAVRRAYHRR